MIAYPNSGTGSLRNIYVVPVAGGSSRQVSFLANTNASAVQWSPDGKFLLYETSQRTETAQIARIDLMPRQPRFAEERFEDLFKAEPAGRGGRGAAAENRPPVKVEIEFEGIRQRISMLPIGLPGGNPQISPDGRSLRSRLLVAGQTSLYLYPLTRKTRVADLGRTWGGEGRVPRQLT